jgi:hypothetical protein
MSITREGHRQAEENYKTVLNAAAKSKETAINNATTAKAEAVKQAQAKLVLPKKRLSEARDRIEAGLHKQELNEARRLQEQILIKAEDNKVKTLKQADELGKRLATEAAETRRSAIQQAYDDEKKMKREAEQAIKTQKETVRVRGEKERKALKRAEQEAAEAKTRGQKAAAAELSAQKALDKARAKGHEPVNIIKSAELSKLVAKPILNIGVPKVTSQSEKSNGTAQTKSRTGLIKLIIAHKDADADHMVDFENSLRKIPDIRLVMIGGTTSDGAQIIVSSEKAVVLSNILRQLPMVEEITDRQADLLVKLKPVVIFESQM